MRGLKIPKSDSRNRWKENIINVIYLPLVTGDIQKMMLRPSLATLSAGPTLVRSMWGSQKYECPSCASPNSWVIQTSLSRPNDTKTVKMIHASQKCEYTTSFLKMSCLHTYRYMFICILFLSFYYLYPPMYVSGRSVLNLIFNVIHTYRTSDWGGKNVKS